MLRLALYQPDIPQNTGVIMRLCACLGVPLDIIEPCGFVLDDRKLARAGMDYMKLAEKTRHMNFDIFRQNYPDSRLILMTTQGNMSYTDFSFQKNDILLAGSESSGVPEEIHKAVDEAVTIPMQQGARSLNVALAVAMILGEASRQTDMFKT